jgi:hypothetical protein
LRKLEFERCTTIKELNMKRVILILVTLAVLLVPSVAAAKTARTEWKNYGFCSSTDTWDANAIKDSNGLWATLKTRFTTTALSGGVGSASNHILWIPIPDGYDYIDLRFRGSAVTTSGTVEVLQITYTGDAEYLFDVALSADASAMAATSIVDGNDTSMTIKHGGYYFGNATDSNSSNMQSDLVKTNCDTTHRACDFCWDLMKSTAVIVHPKGVSSGTIYWDACFWRDEPR